MGTSEDDLLAAARARAESTGSPAEWGELLELAPDGEFRGRWLGEALDASHEPPRPVFLVADRDGRHRWLRHKYQLGQEVERARPQPGDEVAIVRGQDYQTTSGNLGHAYGLACKPWSGPWPPVNEPVAATDDIPF